jgi:hypothetical protein
MHTFYLICPLYFPVLVGLRVHVDVGVPDIHLVDEVFDFLSLWRAREVFCRECAFPDGKGGDGRACLAGPPRMDMGVSDVFYVLDRECIGNLGASRLDAEIGSPCGFGLIFSLLRGIFRDDLNGVLSYFLI